MRVLIKSEPIPAIVLPSEFNAPITGQIDARIKSEPIPANRT